MLARIRLEVWTRIAVSIGVASLVGCGGGGGSSTPVVAPTPPPVIPVEPPGDASSARIVLQTGDLVGDATEIANVEDAALAANGTLAAIVSVANQGGGRAIVRREPGGRFTVVFDDENAPSDVDFRTLVRIRIAPSGQMIFQSGDGLDVERFFYVDGDSISILAGAEPGVVGPDFRVLGNNRIGPNGVVAFVAGGHACEVSVTPGGSLRHVCQISLFVAQDGGVSKVETEGLDLAEVATNAVRIELDPSGNAYFSVPGRREAPTLIRFAGGQATTLLTANQQIPELGSALGDVEAVDISPQGDILISGELPPPEEGAPRPGVLGILHEDGSFTKIAVEGEPIAGETLDQVRAIALDGTGNALYEAQFADPTGTTDTLQRSLRIAGRSGDVEIVREGSPAPDGGATVVSIDAARGNEAGDVVFLTSLGRITEGTVFIEEIRATLREVDGTLRTLVSSAKSAQFGTLSRLLIVGFDENANALLLAERGQSSDRALLFSQHE